MLRAFKKRSPRDQPFYAVFRAIAYLGRHLDGLLAFLADVVVLDFNHKTAQVFGAVRAQLFDRGIVVPGTDSLIAATALTHGLALVTHNVRHFQNIPGLSVIDWLN